MEDRSNSENEEPLHNKGGGIRVSLRCRPLKPYGETSIEEVKARLDKVYESGIPLFTKERIRYAWEEIQREPGHGGKVFTKDIHGELVQYDVITGETRQLKGMDGIDVSYMWYMKLRRLH
jgi:hypothetical protein